MWCFPLFINRLVCLIYSELGIRGWLCRAKTRCDNRVTFVLHSTGLWTAFERQMLHWGLSTGRTAAFEAFFAASVGFSLLVWVFYRPACTGGLFGRFSFILIPKKNKCRIIPYSDYLVYLHKIQTIMADTKVIWVHLIWEKKDYFFGSISAIYDVLTEEQIGITKSSLLHAGMRDGSSHLTKRALIKQSRLIRTKKQV